MVESLAAGRQDQKLPGGFGQENAPIRILIGQTWLPKALNLHFQSHRLNPFRPRWHCWRYQTAQRPYWNGTDMDRTPEIYYFVGEEQPTKRSGNMWVPREIVEKTKAAQKGPKGTPPFSGVGDA